ncbi:MAG: hypothetical protein AB8B97_14530 [Granulosicoccus sp.]
MPDTILIAPQDLQAVSAGQIIQLSSPLGTWATLRKELTEADIGLGAIASVHAGGILYAARGLSSPIPVSLQMDVPGSVSPLYELFSRKNLIRKMTHG